MFVSQKMVLVDLFLLQRDLDSVAHYIIDSESFQASEYSYELSNSENITWTQESTNDRKKMILDLKKNNDELFHFFNSHFPTGLLQDTPKIMDIPSLGDTIRQYYLKKNQFEERSYRIRKQKEEIAVRIAGLQMHMKTQEQKPQMDVNFHSMIGVLSTSNLKILEQEFERFDGTLLTEGHVNDSEIVFISIRKDQQSELEKLLTQLYFINYGLPKEFFGEGSTNMMRLGWEYTTLYDQEDILDLEIKKIADVFYHIFNNLNYSLRFYMKVSDVKNLMKQSGSFVQFSGWIPLKELNQFKNKIMELCHEQCEIVSSRVDSFNIEVNIPTKLKNWRIMKVFEQLVSIFGIPNYRELDPTPIFGFLYVLMYGAMFGDVGQGLVLLLSGIGAKFSRKLKDFDLIWELLIWVGGSATFFGFLYGSYFGYESANQAGIPEPLWISPIHNIDAILAISVFFGVVVISLSFILGIINTIRMRDWATLVFSHKGIFAFITYGLVLLILYLTMMTEIPVPIFVWITVALLSLFLFLERVWEALIYKHGALSDWWMGFFELFEFFLSIFTNTLSFVRIGAFALTHAALMMAVFTLRDLAEDSIMKMLIVIAGNIFVIGMEGFIVGIQTLRLEYYEFFMRFFRGTGKEFKPISLDKS